MGKKNLCSNKGAIYLVIPTSEGIIVHGFAAEAEEDGALQLERLGVGGEGGAVDLPLRPSVSSHALPVIPLGQDVALVELHARLGHGLVDVLRHDGVVEAGDGEALGRLHHGDALAGDTQGQEGLDSSVRIQAAAVDDGFTCGWVGWEKMLASFHESQQGKTP